MWNGNKVKERIINSNKSERGEEVRERKIKVRKKGKE
jgi:hypothetical protein